MIRLANGLTRLGRVQGMQAYCLDCTIAAPAVLDVQPGGWLPVLAGALGMR